jgi:hypothetical protein
MPIADKLRAAADALPPERTTLQTLADAHHPHVREALLVLLGVLSILPVPGVGSVAGIAIMAIAAVSWRGSSETVLPPSVAAFGLTQKWADRLLRTLARLHDWAASSHQPMLPWLVDGLSRRVLSVAIGWMGILIALPIPLGNILPGLALAFAGLGLMRRDGLAMLAAAVCGVLGTIWPIALALLSLSTLDHAVIWFMGG